MLCCQLATSFYDVLPEYYEDDITMKIKFSFMFTFPGHFLNQDSLSTNNCFNTDSDYDLGDCLHKMVTLHGNFSNFKIIPRDQSFHYYVDTLNLHPSWLSGDSLNRTLFCIQSIPLDSIYNHNTVAEHKDSKNDSLF